MRRLKLFLISSTGSFFECYDFMICVFLTKYISQIFFTSNFTLATFSIFTVAFAARPSGGVFWGYLGDKYGRKKVFSFSMNMILVPTLLIAVFPTGFSHNLNMIGFIILRFMQGFIVGGEFAGGVTIVHEIAPKNRIATWLAIYVGFLGAGTLVASLTVLTLEQIYTPQEIIDFAWRIPFILSLFLIIITIQLRKHLFETPFFSALQKFNKILDNPILEIIKYHKLKLFKGFIATCFGAAVLTTFSTYLPEIIINIPHKRVMLLSSESLLIIIALTYFYGRLADRFNQDKIFIVSGILSIFTLIIFMNNKIDSFPAYLIMITVISIANAGTNLLYPAVISQLFPTNVRFTGVAICYTMGFTVCAGILPLLYSLDLAMVRTLQFPIIVFSVLFILFLGSHLFSKYRIS